MNGKETRNAPGAQSSKFRMCCRGSNIPEVLMYVFYEPIPFVHGSLWIFLPNLKMNLRREES